MGLVLATTICDEMNHWQSGAMREALELLREREANVSPDQAQSSAHLWIRRFAKVRLPRFGPFLGACG